MTEHTFVILAYKESPFLESCIQSILEQSCKSEVKIATTTRNSHINSLAKRYNLKIVEGGHTNIGGDFDFAKNCADTELVTIAHQDDIYDSEYLRYIIEAYEKHKNASIVFTDYYEIRDKEKIYKNTNLNIKRVLLLPLRLFKNAKWARRFALRFGDSICCPAVTFVTKNCPRKLFGSDFQCDVDWHAWEKLSRKNNPFVFIPRCLMGHRISNESTTTEIIKNGIRTQEDYEIFCRFWPKMIAKILTKLYRNSEKSNSLEN